MNSATNYSGEENFVYEPIEQPKLGNLIKESRKAQKLTQRQLGQQLNVSYQTIAYWENGSRAPTFVNLMRLAAALGKPDDFFLSPVSKSKPKNLLPTLCDNLRHYRSTFDLSQTRLAELAEIPLSKIRSYENPSSGQFITEEDLEKLCKALHVKREDLLGHSCTMEQLLEMNERNNIERIQAAIQKLNPTGLKTAAERIAELAELPRYRK